MSASGGTSDAPIVAFGLVKSIGRTRALDELDLRVLAGEVHGLLGPNGAAQPQAAPA